MKSIEEINKLKEDWERDSCWDIEDAEGFEDHYEELFAYRKAKEQEWREDRRRKYLERYPYQSAFPTAEGMTDGLSKREIFAAIAFSGLLANSGYSGVEPCNLAIDAVRAADTLIEALNKTEE